MDGKVLLVSEVAERLRVDRKTIYAMIARGELPAARVGACLRVREDAVLRLLAGAGVASALDRPGLTPAVVSIDLAHAPMAHG